LYQIKLPPEPLIKGLPPPDPRPLCPLSSTEFVEQPPPLPKKKSWVCHWSPWPPTNLQSLQTVHFFLRTQWPSQGLGSRKFVVQGLAGATDSLSSAHRPEQLSTHPPPC